MTDTPDLTRGDRVALISQLANSITSRVFEELLASLACCPNCEFFDSKAEHCTNKVNCPVSPGRPPANIIAFGCPQFKPGAPF